MSHSEQQLSQKIKNKTLSIIFLPKTLQVAVSASSGLNNAK